MSETRSGVWAMLMACVVWGLSPLFYKQLAHVPPIEVLAHRTIWSAVFFGVVLLIQRRLPELKAIVRSPKSMIITVLAALMISLNWFMFIWSIGAGKATEASLGYYLFPLVAVLIGRVVFAERLAPLQWAAVGLAACAVLVLTLGLGVAPWIALALAATFGMYGLMKKGLTIGPVVSVTAEVIALSPIAIAVLVWSHMSSQGAFGASFKDTSLLMFSGALTATPLMFFSYAAKRVPMATVGLVQYLNPTLQFLCAVMVFGEPFGPWHSIAFPMIWAALAVYTFATWRQEKARTKAASSASTSGAI